METLAEKVYAKRIEQLREKISVKKYKDFMKKYEKYLIDSCYRTLTDVRTFHCIGSICIEEEDLKEYSDCLYLWLFENGFKIIEDNNTVYII